MAWLLVSAQIWFFVLSSVGVLVPALTVAIRIEKFFHESFAHEHKPTKAEIIENMHDKPGTDRKDIHAIIDMVL